MFNYSFKHLNKFSDKFHFCVAHKTHFVVPLSPRAADSTLWSFRRMCFCGVSTAILSFCSCQCLSMFCMWCQFRSLKVSMKWKFQSSFVPYREWNRFSKKKKCRVGLDFVHWELIWCCLLIAADGFMWVTGYWRDYCFSWFHCDFNIKALCRFCGQCTCNSCELLTSLELASNCKLSGLFYSYFFYMWFVLLFCPPDCKTHFSHSQVNSNNSRLMGFTKAPLILRERVRLSVFH